MNGFGGGIGGSGSVCGAIVGGVAALSQKYGRGGMDEREDPRLSSLSAELYRRFGTEVEESRFCRDITGVDFSKPEEAKLYGTSKEKRQRCTALTGKTAEIVAEIISREEQKDAAQ